MKHKRKEYEYIIKNDLVYINLYQRDGSKHTTIINLSKLNDFLNYNGSWYVSYYKTTNDYYVRTTKYLGTINGKPKRKPIYLHNFLLGFPNAEHIDHKNNNTLDNRIENLRKSKQRDNLKNRQKQNSNNKSGYRNVCLMGHKYRVQLQVRGKNHLFPNKFDNVNDAGKFAKEMREKYYGNYSGN